MNLKTLDTNTVRVKFATKCDGIELNSNPKLIFQRWYIHDVVNSKDYLTNFLIVLNPGEKDEEIITETFPDTIGLKTELATFSQADSQNIYLKPKTRKVNGKDEKSLIYTKKDGSELIFSLALANKIVTIINIAFQGFNPKKLFDINYTDKYCLHINDALYGEPYV